MQCTYVKPNKTQCRARALKGSNYCFFHSKEKEVIKKRKQASTKGGRSSKVRISYPRDNIPLNNISEVLEMLEKVINEVRMGNIEVNRANSIGYLSSLMLKGFDQMDVVTKIQSIERALDLRVG